MAKYLTATFTLPNGKRKYIRATTKTELARKLAEAKQEVNLGIDISNDITVREYAAGWVRLTKTGRITENSETLLVRSIDNHINPYIGSMRVRDVRASHILNIMQCCSGLSRGTQGYILGTMRAIFNAAMDDNLILRSPVPVSLRAGGAKTPETEALTSEQLAEFLDKTRELSVWPIIYAISQTGMRRSEATGLMWSDVDTAKLVIHVRRHAVTSPAGRVSVKEGAKTDAGVRDIPITAEFARWLTERKRTASSVYVFPNRNGGCYSASTLTSAWKTAVNRVDFPVRTHQLRHPYVKHTTKIFSLRLMDFQAQAYPDARRKTRGACQLLRVGQSRSPVRPLYNRKRFSCLPPQSKMSWILYAISMRLSGYTSTRSISISASSVVSASASKIALDASFRLSCRACSSCFCFACANTAA